jgi:hypothetical protein
LIRARYDASKDDAKSKSGANALSKDDRPVLRFKGLVSSAFYPYLGAYVDEERRNLSAVLARIEQEMGDEADDAAAAADDAKDDAQKADMAAGAMAKKEGAKQRFSGSDELFLTIKKSIKRCSKLTTNQTLFDLFKAYKKALSQFAVMLDSRLLKVGGGRKEGMLADLSSGINNLASSSSGKSAAVALSKPLSRVEIRLVCLIINTGEYCSETLTPLAVSLQGKIDAKFKAKIDLTDVQEEYSVLVNQAVGALVDSMCLRTHRVLTQMQKMPWHQWEAVGDESSYVHRLHDIFREDLPAPARLVSSSYHKHMLLKFIRAFIPVFIQSIYKCKRTNQVAAQQLSLDAHALKSVLLSLPHIGSSDVASPTATGAPPVRTASRGYTRYVEREMGKAAALLKVLASHNELLVHNFTVLMGGAKPEDLGKVFELKGLKKGEGQALLAAYNATVADDKKILPQYVFAEGSTLKKLFNFGSSTK